MRAMVQNAINAIGPGIGIRFLRNARCLGNGCMLLFLCKPGVNGGASIHAIDCRRETQGLPLLREENVLLELIACLAAPDVSNELSVMSETAVNLHVACAHSSGPDLIAEDVVGQFPNV